MKYSLEDSLEAWQTNAKFWDECMGDNSNQFHREVVRPKVNKLLDIQKDDYVLDIACGNGNYSAYLANQGVNVVAFDYSSKMIELAKKRQARYINKIEFHVIDATNKQSLMTLKKDIPYTKAVSNMAIMDIFEISTLFKCVNELLIENGTFVFATQHPCFVTLTDIVMKAKFYTLSLALGPYIPLIVVNCIILGRAEAFACSHGPVESLFDGIGIGLGFSLALTLLGAVRELLGAGSIFGIVLLPEASNMLLFILPPGAFITLGFLIAIVNRFKKA